MTNDQSNTSTPQRRVVCAAIRRFGLIICGARHFDPIMREVLKDLDAGGIGFDQGFIDQHGVFMNRKESWVVAEAAGQIVNRSTPGTLFSENLY